MRPIIGEHFHQPLILPPSGNYQITPPLMSDFMRFDQFREECGALAVAHTLRPLNWIEIGQRRQINQPREPLAEGAGDGRDHQVSHGWRTKFRGHKIRCVSDLVRKLFDMIGWIRRKWSDGRRNWRLLDGWPPPDPVGYGLQRRLW